MIICDRCGKAVGTNDWDIHTCTPKPGWCNDCETVAHCLKHGCVPKQESESGKAAYQRGYLDGMAKPCIKCADRQWVGLTCEQIQKMAFTAVRENWDWLRFALAIEAKLKEVNP